MSALPLARVLPTLTPIASFTSERSSANALAGVVLLQVKGAEDLEAGVPRSASTGGGGGLMAAASAKRREVVSQVGHI